MSLVSPFISRTPVDFEDVDPNINMFFPKDRPIYRLTVIPQKRVGSHWSIPEGLSNKTAKVRCFILLPVVNRHGDFIIHNEGRQGVEPPKDEDDLRPISFLVSGVGSLTVRVANKSYPIDAIHTVLEFKKL